jgi:hypothetical protein
MTHREVLQKLEAIKEQILQDVSIHQKEEFKEEFYEIFIIATSETLKRINYEETQLISGGYDTVLDDNVLEMLGQNFYTYDSYRALNPAWLKK